MYSTCRSGESRGYCDLHRRGLGYRAEGPLPSERRRAEFPELLGVRRWMMEGEGERRGWPLTLEGLVVAASERVESSVGR